MKKAIFKKELSGRFLCEVDIDDRIELCYVPSSSHLSPYINLKDKKVLLKKNKGKNLRTKYTLYAVEYNDTYILLNLNDLNDIFLKFLNNSLNNSVEAKKEYKINKYKSDYYIPKYKKVIEIKGVISEDETAIYNFNTHARAYAQLKSIKGLLKEGYKVDYVFVILTPQISKINISDKRLKENKLFIECIRLGMDIKFYKTIYLNNQFKLFEQNILKNF